MRENPKGKGETHVDCATKIGRIGSAEESVIVCQEFVVVFSKELCVNDTEEQCVIAIVRADVCEGLLRHRNVMQSGSSLDNGVE